MKKNGIFCLLLDYLQDVHRHPKKIQMITRIQKLKMK